MTSKREDIVAYWHCRKCLLEKPNGISPREFQNIQMGWTKDGGVMAWCERHDLPVARLSMPPAIEACRKVLAVYKDGVDRKAMTEADFTKYTAELIALCRQAVEGEP